MSRSKRKAVLMKLIVLHFSRYRATGLKVYPVVCVCFLHIVCVESTVSLAQCCVDDCFSRVPGLTLSDL